MTKNKFRIIVLLMSIALVGIVSLQFAMIRDSYIQKQQLFDQNVNAALVDVVKKVEKEEAIDFIQKKSNKLNNIYVKTTISEQSSTSSRKKSENKKRELQNLAKENIINAKKHRELSAKIQEHARLLEIDRENKNIAENQRQIKILSDSLNELNHVFNLSISDNAFTFSMPEIEVWNDSVFFKSRDKLNKKFKARRDSFVTYYSYSTGKERESRLIPPAPPRSKVIVKGAHPVELPPSPPNFPIAAIEGPLMIFEHQPREDKKIVKKYFDNQKKEKLEIIQDLAAELDALNVPIEKRIKPEQIDSLLKIELNKRGINIAYDLLINNQKDKIFFNTSDTTIISNDNLYSVTLFDSDGDSQSAKINIVFPDKGKKLSNEMGPTLGSSAVLLIILTGCFVYTIRAILKQKKLSDLKNDFINNMTHEFKTPVSTILLASEALKDPEVINDEPRVKRLAGIIYDENLRLGEHVERVLNMARMDKGEIRLAMNSVSLHEVTQDVINHFELTLASKNQRVITNFKASNADIYADAFHLKNIVQNLIDNASKYSKEGSTIFIDTENFKNNIVIKVRDQGLGMKKDQIKKIFEPFYRVPTGNLHDVKGFGIGLHYVYSILKEMGGKINVKSEIGVGSEFSLTFPNK